MVKRALCGHEEAEKLERIKQPEDVFEILTFWWPGCISKRPASIIFSVFHNDIVNHNTQVSHASIRSLHLVCHV